MSHRMPDVGGRHNHLLQFSSLLFLCPSPLFKTRLLICCPARKWAFDCSLASNIWHDSVQAVQVMVDDGNTIDRAAGGLCVLLYLCTLLPAVRFAFFRPYMVYLHGVRTPYEDGVFYSTLGCNTRNQAASARHGIPLQGPAPTPAVSLRSGQACSLVGL